MIVSLSEYPDLTPGNHKLQQYDANHESGLVKVVGIHVEDAILGAHSCHKVKSCVNCLRVFSQSLLAIVPARPAGFELQSPFDKVVWPADSNGFAAVRLKEFICYIAKQGLYRQKFMQIQVQHVVYDCCLFEEDQLCHLESRKAS